MELEFIQRNKKVELVPCAPSQSTNLTLAVMSVVILPLVRFVRKTVPNYPNMNVKQYPKASELLPL